MNPRRLYRSADDRLIAGVAGGLAAYLDVDPIIVRIVWFLAALFSVGLALVAYVIMIMVVPLEPAEWPPQSPWAPGGAPVGSEAATTPPTAGPTPGDASVTPAASGPGAAFAGAPPPAAGGWWSGDWRAQSRQERWQQRAERYEYRAFGGPGLVFGLMLVLIGGLLAWHQFDPNFDLNRAWPIAIIVFGGILVVSAFRFRK